ncbi:hypothetical protein [Daejeonella sp. JGW-45]|uniref:hypothetical protein n=1 Tax=Daejeonella sp. JGW-45 TaxID=3034148 RepID=UPI0023ECE8B3|nr:hypothetical protein [Daejeonella sp. JGW-45]
MRLKKTIPALPVVSIEDAIAFYESKMAFKARHKEQYFAILIRDEVEIHLWASCDKSWKFTGLLRLFKPIWSGAESFLAGTASCRIEVEGIDELYQHYKQADVLHNKQTIVETQHWGQRDFATVDLYGNLLTFYENS